MKKLILSAAFLMLTAFSFAQVGIGTTAPTTTLDVVGAAGDTPGALAATDGVTVPRVTTDMTASPAAGTTASQLVYSTHASSTGFYYWSGTAWLPIVPVSSAPDFTSTATLSVDGTGGTADLSANTANNIFLISTASFGAACIVTLPTPNAANTGRIIIIINSFTGGSAVQMTNAYNPGSIPQGESRAFYCDGTIWIAG